MKVVTTEYEPQVRAIPGSEILAPVCTLPIRRRSLGRRVMLTPAVCENRLFHAL